MLNVDSSIGCFCVFKDLKSCSSKLQGNHALNRLLTTRAANEALRPDERAQRMLGGEKSMTINTSPREHGPTQKSVVKCALKNTKLQLPNVMWH